MIRGETTDRKGVVLFLALAALALACGSDKKPVKVPDAPCDLYAAGGTPCVAAHATTRALYKGYKGGLYQVIRSSDQKTLDIGPLTPGGVANAAAQDTFCKDTTCLITIIYDQSPRGNHLTRAPPGGPGDPNANPPISAGFKGPEADGSDKLAVATAAPIIIDGHRAYGVYITSGTGYRNNAATGVAKGDDPEGMYAIMDGTRYNDQCCFDYGNAETSSTDTGDGHMEAIYFGNDSMWGSGAGKGPWVMGDLENGMFSGEGLSNNANDPTITFQWLTAIVKGKPGHWAIRAGDAQTGSLATYFDGGRPKDATGTTTRNYDPMSKEGAIVLGSGGDNSNGAIGTFFEGAMTTGYPSNATEDAVQANVVAARYGKSAVTCTQAPPTPVNLKATPVSSYQFDLSWSPVTPQATCWVFYNVYRDGTLLAGNLTTTTYTDGGLTPATAYQYYVQAVDSAGASANSATANVTTGEATAISINVGGPAVGNFLPDGYFKGGLTYTNTATITPPAGVLADIFSTERYGNTNDNNGAFTYSFQGFTAGSEWTVTLYFSETYLTAAGQRFFEVDINGRPVLAEWDLYAAAGGVNLGVSRSFPVTVDTDGKIVIDFKAGSLQNAKVNAIAITAGLPPPDVQAPTAPGTPAASNVTSTTATLTWTASTDDVGLAGYDIYSGTTLVGSSLKTTSDIGNLTAGTSYTFTVKARDAAGNVSVPSVEVLVTTSP